ncbi:MAG: Flp family type IVb pilin [Nitratireductor sp.]
MAVTRSTDHETRITFLQEQSGATAIEYGLIAALISVAIIGGASAVGGGVNTTFTNIKAQMPGA